MSINEATLERIKGQLRQAKDIGGNVPQDLYSHLTEVFNRILLHHADDAYDKFEEISALVKATDLKFKDPKFDDEVNKEHGTRAMTDAERWVQKSKNLLNEVNDLVSAKEQALLTKDKLFVIPNFQDDCEMLEWAGITFGAEDSFRLAKSIKRLAIMSGAEKLRFCGKIFGTHQDYWIVSGSLDQAEEAPDSKNVEKRGEGVNKLVYWVTDNPLHDWIQLPDCRPEYIVAARKIKHIFTGDLNASFDSNPTFPGKERHLLRATLARIFSATAVVPKGLFEQDEDTQQIKFAEDFAMPSTSEMQSLETWVNVHPSILKVGRATHTEPPEDMEDEERQALMDKLAEDDKPDEQFRAIAEHTPMPGMETAWLSKVVGDQQLYNQLPPKEGSVSYAVNVIKSLRWPGAVTVAKGGKFTNIYVGYGLKRGDPIFNPTEPPEVQKDPEETGQQDEPKPKAPEDKAVEGEEGEEEG